MTEQLKQRELTPEELEEQQAAELPDREAMSLIDANVAAPVNAAAGLNVIAEDSTATATATQTSEISQSND